MHVFNQVHSSGLLTFSFVLIFGQVISALQLKTGNFNIWMSILYIQTVAVCILVNIFMYGLSATVHTECIRFFKKVKSSSSIKSKICLKTFASLQIVKVGFGSANYIEKLTPVIFQKFATERVIDVLILSSKNIL